MSFVPKMNVGEAPPNQTGRIWFLRSCVGLSFALFSAALSQPFMRFNTGAHELFRTSQVYPFTSGSGTAPTECSQDVIIAFAMIIMVGICVGTLSIEDYRLNMFVVVLSNVLAFVSILYCTLLPFAIISGEALGTQQQLPHATPLAGPWLIAVAAMVLTIAHVGFNREVGRIKN